MNRLSAAHPHLSAAGVFAAGWFRRAHGSSESRLYFSSRGSGGGNNQGSRIAFTRMEGLLRSMPVHGATHGGREEFLGGPTISVDT